MERRGKGKASLFFEYKKTVPDKQPIQKGTQYKEGFENLSYIGRRISWKADREGDRTVEGDDPLGNVQRKEKRGVQPMMEQTKGI